MTATEGPLGLAAQPHYPKAESEKPYVLTRRDLVPILTLEEITDDDLEAFVAGLPEERIPQAIVRIADFRKGLKRLEEMLESRFATTELATMVWVDPASDLRYAWMTGGKTGKFEDRVAFLADLHEAGFSPQTTAEAIAPTGIRITVLREAAKGTSRERELESIIKKHRTFGTGAPHLKCLDQKEDD